MVFLTCVACYPPNTRPDGVMGPSFFWDAYFKGLVPADVEREQQVSALLNKEKSNTAFQDMRLRLMLDAGTYANDLWTTVAFHWVNTVWTSHLADNFLRPRRSYADPDARPHSVADMRADGLEHHDLDVAIRNARASDAAKTVRICHNGFPVPMRERTCVLVIRDCPHYAAQFEADLRTRYEAFYPAAVQSLRQDGFSALEVGADFTEADYYDRCHLNEDGGGKLAGQVADAVRALAERLGYLDR
jgi:hypothetical protein